jgi:hypothetical protein
LKLYFRTDCKFLLTKQAGGAPAAKSPFALPQPIAGHGRQGQGLAAQRSRTAALMLPPCLPLLKEGNSSLRLYEN